MMSEKQLKNILREKRNMFEDAIKTYNMFHAHDYHIEIVLLEHILGIGKWSNIKNK